MPRSAKTRTREIPVSSCTSRRAAPSVVSPSSMVPLGNIHLPLVCCSNSTSGRPFSRRNTTPPALRARFTSFRVPVPVVFTRRALPSSPAGEETSLPCSQQLSHELTHCVPIGAALHFRHDDRHNSPNISGVFRVGLSDSIGHDLPELIG